ncbi:hypothetical protein [Clavibacter nebraskensis]|uniref:hypothetical protein n=1 Tax=Clavibacter nebraskensis TaxID=31963 RepID=UPI00200D6D4D|nr:hypothetical protein [Clavibacter nebraskensis]UQB14594.1 hypothetical protein LIX20_001216 [Clavibacter nebraskensis]UQB17426.1 hypothetical protein LIX22_001215 [Clavibacter nebraskensis]
MKKIIHGGVSVLVGDNTADALLTLAASLAATGAVEPVMLDTVGNDGRTVPTGLLVGAGMPLMTASSDSGAREPENAAATADIEARTRYPSDPQHIPHEDSWPGSHVHFDS